VIASLRSGGSAGRLLTARFGSAGLLRETLDVPEQATLSRFGQRDRHPLASGAANSTDPVDIALRRGRNVVVHDMGEGVDIESTGSDIGGDQHFGRAIAQAAHDPIALLLIHAAVQGLSPVPPAIHRLGQLINLGAGATLGDSQNSAISLAEISRVLRVLDVVLGLAKTCIPYAGTSTEVAGGVKEARRRHAITRAHLLDNGTRQTCARSSAPCLS